MASAVGGGGGGCGAQQPGEGYARIHVHTGEPGEARLPHH